MVEKIFNKIKNADRTNLFVAVLIVVFLIISVVSGISIITKENSFNRSKLLSDVEATATYNGNNLWSYYIKGIVPADCTSLETEVGHESDEYSNATIYVNIEVPSDVNVCKEQEEFEVSGKFTSLVSSEIKLIVEQFAESTEPYTYEIPISLDTSKRNVTERTHSNKGFTLDTNYTGQGNWNYNINGEEITGCYNVWHEVNVSTDNPENVLFEVHVQEMSTSDDCKHSPNVTYFSGSFYAGEDALIDLKVIRN